VAGSCEHARNYSGPINVGKFLASKATVSFVRWTLHRGLNLISDNFMWSPCHHGMARLQFAGGGDGLQTWRVAASWGQPTRDCPPASWGLGEGLTTPLLKSQLVTKCYTGPQVGFCEHGNEFFGFHKRPETIDQLNDY
jgi:hypothetical protein